MYEDHTYEDGSPPSLWDRIGIGAVALLLIAFLIGTMAPLMSSAAGEITGKRDDDSRELVAVEDDDDDDDDRLAKGSLSGNSGNSQSNSANTRTGTTKGTGHSKTATNSSDRSANTKTGTTNTGQSKRSISNSS